MKRISIIYWSSTGNTEIMAESIYDSFIKLNPDQITLSHVNDATSNHLETSDLVILGCSAMGVESVDESEMAPFLLKNKSLLNNKKVALFGSYDWGDGEWLESWATELESYGAEINQNKVMIQNTPDQEGIVLCEQFAQKLFKLI